MHSINNELTYRRATVFKFMIATVSTLESLRDAGCVVQHSVEEFGGRGSTNFDGISLDRQPAATVVMVSVAASQAAS